MFFFGLLVAIHHQFTICKIPHSYGGGYEHFGLLDLLPCSVVVRYLHIRGTSYLLLQG